MKHGVKLETINARTLQPFELNNPNDQLKNYYLSKIKPKFEGNWVDNGFLYVLKVKAGFNNNKNSEILEI